MSINKKDSKELCNGVYIYGGPCTGKTTLINKIKSLYDFESLGVPVLFLDDYEHRYTNAAIKMGLSNNDFVVIAGNSHPDFRSNEVFFCENNISIFPAYEIGKAEEFIKDKIIYLVSLIEREALNSVIESKSSKQETKRI